MAVIWIIFYGTLILAFGFLTLCLPGGGGGIRRGALETIVLSFALGAGNMGFFLFFASLAGIVPSRSVLGGLTIGIAIALLLLWRRDQLLRLVRAPINLRVEDLVVLVPIALLVAVIVVVILHALYFSFFLEWDAFALWGLKAKVLAHESLRADPAYFRDATFSFSHPDYPLMLAFLTAGFHGAIGRVDERLAKIIHPAIFVFYGALTYLGIRWKLPRNESLLLASAALALPICVRWAGSGDADLLLTFFYAGSIFFLVRWIEENAKTDLVLAALFTGYGAFTKFEGLGLALINGIVVCLFLVQRFNRERLRAAILFGVIAGTLVLPWLLWSRGLPATHETSLTGLLASKSNFPIVLRAFAAQPFAFNTWGGLWILLALAAVIGWRGFGSSVSIALWLLLAAHIALYFAVFLATKYSIEEQITHLERIMFHASPAIVYLIGYHWAAVGERGKIAKG